MVNKIKTCIFISGDGSNLESIIKNSREYNFPIKIELIISNNINAYGLKIAKKYSIPTIDVPHGIPLYANHPKRWDKAKSTYLNNVKVGGETEFKYQNLKVKPKKGLSLIWPTDFTHVHRGIVAPKEDKWIVTGWFKFIL